jgi:hypothetical protein
VFYEIEIAKVLAKKNKRPRQRNKLLPVLLEWVSGMSRVYHEERLESSVASVSLLVALADQLQEIWASGGLSSSAGCNQWLDTMADNNSPFIRFCKEGALVMVQGMLASAKVREAAGGGEWQH